VQPQGQWQQQQGVAPMQVGPLDAHTFAAAAAAGQAAPWGDMSLQYPGGGASGGKGKGKGKGAQAISKENNARAGAANSGGPGGPPGPLALASP
jgi:hypothetical protein